jgi:hypothetical protein
MNLNKIGGTARPTGLKPRCPPLAGAEVSVFAQIRRRHRCLSSGNAQRGGFLLHGASDITADFAIDGGELKLIRYEC